MAIRSVTPEKVERPPDIRRFTLAEYRHMVDTGVFGPEERVELIKGVVYTMTAKGPRHNRGLTRLTRLFYTCVTETIIISVQDSIELTAGGSQPEPDLALLKPRADDYVDRLPTAQDVLLIVEVAQTSLQHDREVKSELYAEAGISEYWLINLVKQCIEVMRDPGVGADGKAIYRSQRVYVPGESLSPVQFPNCRVDVNDVIPGLPMRSA